MDTTEDDTKTFEFTESATTTTYATTTDADGEGEGDGDGDGVGGLQVAEMPNLNMDGIMEEVARGSKEEDVDAAAKAEKRKRLKEARNKRFGLEPEVVEQTIEEEVEEEEVSEEVPDTEPEPQKKPPPPQPVSETDEPQDIYALDELEAAKLMEVVSEISVASTPSYDDNAIQRKSDFLKLFEMPSFSDISSEESVIVVRPKKKAPSPRVSKRASSRKKSKLVVESEEPTAAGESSDKEDEESSSSALIEIDSSDLALDKFKPREVPTVGFGDTAIEIFDMIQDGTAKVQQMRMSEMLRTKHKRELDTLVAEFVDQLLCDTVNKYEIGLVELMQRGRFDKMKLYNDLQNTVDNCLIEQQKNNYLNLKMVEYHRRNKNFRAFDKLAPKLAKFEHERYQIALCQLDFAKQKAAEAKKKNAYLMSSVMMDLMHIQNLNIDIEEHLDTVFRNTFALKSEGFRKHVEREMRHMQNTRYEISDVRLALITRKHTLGIIKEVSLICSALRFLLLLLLTENQHTGAHQRRHRDE